MARPVLAACLLIFCGSACLASDTIFEGPWHTTNRKLDGIMTCVVHDLGNGNWQGRFSGNWHGVDFDYAVPFTGPPTHLRGTAQIDGADYTWTGSITSNSPATFQGTFGGTRYEGYFVLKEKPTTAR
jgi:hypothetical protein